MSTPPSAEADRITAWFHAWRGGDEDAGEVLFARVYDELRRLASGQLRGGRGSVTLQTTALVHEAYLRLVGASGGEIHDRAHLLAVAATAMRQIVVDHARRRGAAKRGGDAVRVELADSDAAVASSLAEVLAVDAALERLATLDPRLARTVEMRFFAGLSVAEVALALDVSERTVKRDWRTARAFLHRELASGAGP